MKIHLTVLVALMIAMTSSCLNDKPDDTVPASGCDTTYYGTTIYPIIETKCMGNNPACHITGGSGNGDYSKFVNLKQKIDNGSFQDRVFVVKDMPPAGYPQLTQAELNILTDWVSSGYPGCD
jgi:hypothetical protein